MNVHLLSVAGEIFPIVVLYILYLDSRVILIEGHYHQSGINIKFHQNKLKY